MQFDFQCFLFYLLVYYLNLNWVVMCQKYYKPCFLQGCSISPHNIKMVPSTICNFISKSPYGVRAYSLYTGYSIGGAYNGRRTTYDVRRKMYDFSVWHIRCLAFDIRCPAYDIRRTTYGGQHVTHDVECTCERRTSYKRTAYEIQTNNRFIKYKKIGSLYQTLFLGGESITAFLLQIGSHDRIMYYGKLNCMLYKIW